MKAGLALLMVSLVAVLAAAPKEGKAEKADKKIETEGETYVLPKLVVVGHTIPSYWLEVTWVCANPLPFCPIKEAWISKVGYGTPVADLGIKKGDKLLEFDGQKMGAMTGEMLHDALTQWRAPGAHLVLTIQTPGEKERKVVIEFSKADNVVERSVGGELIKHP